jgi:hypothetical protein
VQSVNQIANLVDVGDAFLQVERKIPQLLIPSKVDQVELFVC